MKVTVRDSEILKTIEPGVLASHLRTQGWYEKARIYDNDGAVWRLKNNLGDEEEILFPLNQNLGDYVARISDVLKTLERVENRSQLEILSNLITFVSHIEIPGMVSEVNWIDSRGTVTLMGVVLDKLRRIYIELGEPEYAQALKAYQERLPVICKGDLIKEGNSFVLKNIRHFSFLSL